MLVLRLPFLVELEFGNVGFLKRRDGTGRDGTGRSYRRKTSRSKGDSLQQTQPTFGVDAGI